MVSAFFSLISFQLGFAKKICLIKGKNLNNFCSGCLKSVVRKCKLIFGEKKFIRASVRTKIGKSQEVSGVGRLKIFK